MASLAECTSPSEQTWALVTKELSERMQAERFSKEQEAGSMKTETEAPAQTLARLQRRAAELAGSFSDMTAEEYYGETRADLERERPTEPEETE